MIQVTETLPVDSRSWGRRSRIVIPLVMLLLLLLWVRGYLAERRSYLSTGLNPVWSPDGESIAVMDNAGGIAVIDVKTGDYTFLAKGNFPQWDADGEYLLYEAYGPPIRHPEVVMQQIAIIDRDGTDGRMLTEELSSAIFMSWSPDGNWIAYHIALAEQTDFSLVIMKVDGSQRQVLAEHVRPSAEWSSDSNSLVFLDSTGGMFRIGRDGTDLRNLEARNVYCCNPELSPNGTQIAYVGEAGTTSGNPGVDHNIWIMNADGSGQYQLTRDGGVWPQWSPDGEYLSFANRGYVYLIRADGTEMRRLSDLYVEFQTYGWSPNWDQLALMDCGYPPLYALLDDAGLDLDHHCKYEVHIINIDWPSN